MDAIDELLEKLRMLKYDYDSMSTSLEDAIDDIAYELEQAITATLGSGTCKNKAPRYLDFLCSECGFVHYIDDSNCTGDGNEWNYCPKCGKEVER